MKQELERRCTMYERPGPNGSHQRFRTGLEWEEGSQRGPLLLVRSVQEGFELSSDMGLIVDKGEGVEKTAKRISREGEDALTLSGCTNPRGGMACRRLILAVIWNSELVVQGGSRYWASLAEIGSVKMTIVPGARVTCCGTSASVYWDR